VPGTVDRPVEPEPETAETLYSRAEDALAAGKRALADALLEKLVADFPADRLVDEARLERARIAVERGDGKVARQHLAPVVAEPSLALATQAHYLSCRIAVQEAHADADDCLARFLLDHPRSARRREILEWGARRAHAAGGCANAEAWIAELVGAAPDWSATLAWRRACPETGR
jgi:predicted Zn-dependent protease